MQYLALNALRALTAGTSCKKFSISLLAFIYWGALFNAKVLKFPEI